MKRNLGCAEVSSAPGFPFDLFSVGVSGVIACAVAGEALFSAVVCVLSSGAWCVGRR